MTLSNLQITILNTGQAVLTRDSTACSVYGCSLPHPIWFHQNLK